MAKKPNKSDVKVAKPEAETPVEQPQNEQPSIEQSPEMKQADNDAVQENSLHPQSSAQEEQVTTDEIASEAAEESEANKLEENQAPKVLQMTENFKLEYPLPCRRDTTMRMSLKAGQEITDKYLIEYLLNNKAPVVVIE